MKGEITRKILDESGPHPASRKSVFVYSIGTGVGEGHGSAIDARIDNFTAQYAALEICRRLGCTYIGDLPQSSGGSGPISKVWNPGWMDSESMLKGIIAHLKRDIEERSGLGMKPSKIVIISGHGGNRSLEQKSSEISKKLDVPVKYVPPFPQEFVGADHPELGRVIQNHADHSEHSVAAFLGLMDSKKLDKINKTAAKDPVKALENDPPIMGLGYYSYVMRDDPRFAVLKGKGLYEEAKKFVEEEKRIVADSEMGREIIESWIKFIQKEVLDFIE